LFSIIKVTVVQNFTSIIFRIIYVSVHEYNIKINKIFDKNFSRFFKFVTFFKLKYLFRYKYLSLATLIHDSKEQ